MVQSMTGFGKSEIKDEICHCCIEARSLNSRHAEIRVFGLKEMLELESEIIAKVKKRFHRGKFDISIKLQPVQTDTGLDEKVAAAS
ncbi:MAG: YicC/YloC family endoribonuclease [Bdellovibrionota bacterium]